jgi:hypothetical protein
MPPATPAPTGAMQVQLGYDPTGPVEQVDIVSSKDGWSEYTLQDETVIRAKAVVLDAKKMVGQFNAQGEPIYVLQLTVINQVKAPAHLKKKG